MLDSIYHNYEIKVTLKSFWHKNAKVLLYKRNIVMEVIT